MANKAILREWFERVDTEKSGNITAPQLKSALSVGNLDLPLSIVQQMIRMYDFDHNGTMSFTEFVALNEFLLKVQIAFTELARGRDYLLPEDVHKGLEKIGFSLDSPALYTVCESFDREKNGRFHLDDFIALSIFSQSAKNLFRSFDTANQGRGDFIDKNGFESKILPFLFSSRSGGKATAVQQIRKVHGYKSLARIGDGATDLEARKMGGADLFICYAAVQLREAVAAKADWLVYNSTELINSLDSLVWPLRPLYMVGLSKNRACLGIRLVDGLSTDKAYLGCLSADDAC